MKTKILTKLISAVCVAALTTSCAVISVGAVPPKGQTEQTAIDWKQEIVYLNNLIYTAEQVKNNGYTADECSDLVNDSINFLNGAACNKITEDIENIEGLYDREDTLTSICCPLGVYNIALKSNELQMRKLGVNGLINISSAIIKLIENNYLQN